MKFRLGLASLHSWLDGTGMPHNDLGKYSFICPYPDDNLYIYIYMCADCAPACNKDHCIYLHISGGIFSVLLNIMMSHFPVHLTEDMQYTLYCAGNWIQERISGAGIPSIHQLLTLPMFSVHQTFNVKWPVFAFGHYFPHQHSFITHTEKDKAACTCRVLEI